MFEGARFVRARVKATLQSVGMIRHRVLGIGLDGLDVTLAERFMAEGQMPALAELRKRAARFLLDPGDARRAGLPWENVTSGLSPEAAGRWSPVEFDPTAYTAWQDGSQFAPWWAEADLRVVVFDTPFVDLRRARNTRGIVGWGAHDPGSPRAAQPAELLTEFLQRFGNYPAAEYTYDLPWRSAARARLMGESLSQALDVRSRANRWLAIERFPDWDFFFCVPSELHSGAEGLWHGVDIDHPLNPHPSAGASGAALLEIHRALDRMIGQLVDVASDAAIVAFNIGGMGPNKSDIQSMVLLPELLYRHAFGHPLLTMPSAWTATPDRLPILDEHENWDTARASWFPELVRREPESALVRASRAVARRLPEPLKDLLKGARSHEGPVLYPLDWQPALRYYRQHWPRMPAFALPAYSDGRVRINLRGRERHGIVELSQYEETLRTIENLLRECRNPRTGEPAVARIDRTSTRNPLALTSSESDLYVIWNNVAAALEHPRLGLIGPVPLRRTGGHIGQGVAYLVVPGLDSGERGVRSSFDVVPTIVQLLGIEPATRPTGNSLL